MNPKILVQLDLESANIETAFEAISALALKENIISDEADAKALVLALKEREAISTTAMEDGFAIPHARISTIKEAAIVVSRFKAPIAWTGATEPNVVVALSLLVPEKQAETMHIEILAQVATLLLEADFRNNLKTLSDASSIQNYIETQLAQKAAAKAAPSEKQVARPVSKSTNEIQIKVVGVSACATGVAHTYMAKEALEKAGAELGWDVKIETQGQKGMEFNLSEAEIAAADAVVFATDIYVDPERFIGKRSLNVKTNDAISNPRNVLIQAIKQESAMSKAKMKAANAGALGAGQFKNTKIKTFMGHLLSGVSRMIPFIVFSGILWAIFNSIQSGLGIVTEPGKPNFNADFKVAKDITEIGFTVFIAMMGGFIAESIAGRAGLAVGFITTFAAASTSTTFWWGGLIPQIQYFFGENTEAKNVSLSLFAAILMGFASGSLVKWVNSWKTHRLITPIMPIIFIPVVCSAVIVFPFIFLLSGPLGFIMNGIVYGISEGGRINGLNFFIGCILGAMIGFDMGGPVNKMAGTTATAMIVVDPRLMGAVATAIPIAPLGCGLATLIGRKMFTEKEKGEGVTALGLGFFGISEGAIPFAVNRPKKVLICNVVASSIAGGLAFLFFVGGYVGMWGGPITAFVLGVKAPVSELASLGTTIPSAFGGAAGGMEFLSILWFFVAVIAGAALHATLLVFFIKLDKAENRQAYQERFYAFRKKLHLAKR